MGPLVGCGAPEVEGPTYYADVKPILDGYCTTCHADEAGIAPMALDTYEGAVAHAEHSAVEASARRMPPWGAAPGNTPLKFDVSLSDDQIETLVAWAADPRQGEAAEEGAAIEVDRGGLARIDHELQMPFEYEPHATSDDYRCFALDWPEEDLSYITGFVGIPGNKEVVHHLLTFMVQPDQAELVGTFDDLYPDGPGWPCFGGPTPSVDYEGEGIFGQMLGVWAPGMDGMTLPEGTGIPVSPGSVPVLQVHYSTLSSIAPDQSSLGVMVSQEPVRAGFVLPFFDLGWYVDPSSMLIEAGVEDVEHTYAEAVRDNVIFQYLGFDQSGVELHSVFPHMHRLGTSIRVTMDAADGVEDVLIDVPAYDFNWQREFVFEESVVAEPDDVLGIECHWDNTEAYREAHDISPTEPEEVGWGEGTVDEMCIATLYMTAP